MGILKKLIFAIGVLAIILFSHTILQEEFNTPIQKLKCLEIINKTTPLKCHFLKLLETTEELESSLLSKL